MGPPFRGPWFPLGPCGTPMDSIWLSLDLLWCPFGVPWGALGLPLGALGGPWDPLQLLSRNSCTWEPRVSRSHTYDDKICDSGTHPQIQRKRSGAAEQTPQTTRRSVRMTRVLSMQPQTKIRLSDLCAEFKVYLAGYPTPHSPWRLRHASCWCEGVLNTSRACPAPAKCAFPSLLAAPAFRIEKNDSDRNNLINLFRSKKN